jgi:hypothetical protein
MVSYQVEPIEAIKKISLIAAVGGLHYWGNRGAGGATPQSSGCEDPVSTGNHGRVCYALIGLPISVAFDRCTTLYMLTRRLRTVQLNWTA